MASFAYKKSAKISKKRAIEKLKRLSKKQSLREKDKENNRKITAQLLSSILREGLETENLFTIKIENSKKWKTFIKELESASYAKEPLTQAMLDDLFKQAQQWLKQA